MKNYPAVRDEEFESAASFLKSKPGSTILDLPAGGGYLKPFLPKDIYYLAYDFSGEFDDQHSGIKKCKESRIELGDETVDEIISLAALHHVVERGAFYAEMFRILKPGGQFIIGDVVRKSKVDPFLNKFLDQWNSMGHRGRFIDREVDEKEIRGAGFTTRFEIRDFNWNFSTAQDAMLFFRELFFLDLDPPAEQLRGALADLGISEEGLSYHVKWSLGFIVAQKISR